MIERYQKAATQSKPTGLRRLLFVYLQRLIVGFTTFSAGPDTIMTRTELLRRQHDAAERIVGEILEAIDTSDRPANAYAISLALAKLHGLLRIHLAQEDHGLYPSMIGSDDAAASQMAAAFQAEMGGLSKTFGAYVERWGTSTAIDGNFRQFAEETKTVLGALAHRIKRENEELYPLADALRDEGRPRAA